MSRQAEQQSARQEKRRHLQRLGRDPYPSEARCTHTLAEVRRSFDALAAEKKVMTIAGRLTHIRAHGGSTFFTLAQSEANFQVYCKKDVLGAKEYDLWIPLIDLGDFCEFTGTLFTTKKGEHTLQATGIRMLSKALRPVPEEHYGLKDVETRLRKRYLDLLLHPDLRQVFKKKAVFWQTVRQALLEKDFLEVETPVLESVPGGAEAEPFLTHYNALDRDCFLRISLELPLKRLLVGGFDRVFEIGRIFRNEGMSPEHLQDYTQMEMYWAYADYKILMSFLPDLYRRLALALHGTTKVTNNGTTLDLAEAWQDYDYSSLFEHHVGLQPETATLDELRSAAHQRKIRIEKYAGKGRLIDVLYKKLVRPTLVQPGFLLNPPVEIEPLAKRLPDKPSCVQRLQIMMWGTELGKGFSELNDPVDQRQRFEDQMKLRSEGDKEAQRLDEDFLEALEYGMPPAAGFGMSERVFAFFMDRPVRETVLFPAVRPTGAPHAPYPQP